MARRQRSAEDLGPVVPRWVVVFDPVAWPGGVGEWSGAVHGWARENLFKRGEFAAWIDVTRNSYVVRDEMRAKGYWGSRA